MSISALAPKQAPKYQVNAADDMEIENVLDRAPRDAGQARLVLVILPEANTALYNKVKQIGDIKLGVHTICMMGSKFSNGHPQYFANVALKFNLKLDDINQLIDNTSLGIIKDKTMVVNIDVTHPSPNSMSHASSVAGVVTSVDRYLGHWPADLRIQEAREEMMIELGSILKPRLSL